jgi:hypothetical protein
MAGEYRHSEIVLEFELLDGSLAQALSTYVHELCHEAGRDGDAKFSDELTSALGIAFELHGVIAGLERCWKQIAVEDPAKLEVALGEAEPALRMQALVRMVSD